MPHHPRLIAVSLLLAACGGGDTKAAARTPPAARAVSLVQVERVELARRVQVHGTLLALDELVLGFQVTGRLVDLRVDLGDDVGAGDLLAALDRRDFELDRARAAAELDQARAQLGLQTAEGQELDLGTVAAVREAEAVLADARLQQGRTLELVQKQLKPPAELDAANAALAVAQSRVQRARDQARTWLAELEVKRQQLAIADKRLLDAEIRAPWPGRVATRHTAVGQYLTAGSPVVTLLRVDPLRLRMEVPERQAVEVRLGHEVEFTVDGSSESFSGKVTRLGSGIDRVNRTLLVEAAVDNQDHKLLPGAFCRAAIVVAAAEPAVAVPIEAVASFAGVDRLFTVAEGKAVEHLVTLGRRLDGRVEVLAGVAAGDSVVAAPGNLVNGDAVRVESR
ncbi:MAG: efflux RND transporter periplasmic adaptor subunit [Planctomycetes bacterium]|nr:efflux RND transporter periplasmic adaptor subunit [Planctomycetota bacterium]MCB9885417.1 efflux RND transporter periplasmic adaptor subunit [Planctomycetota bacterium]